MKTLIFTESLINQMVERFLAWPLPKDFGPDCGISFDGRKDDEWNKNKSWPVGTNLFTYDQAKEMLLHMLAVLPLQQPAEETTIFDFSELLDAYWDAAYKEGVEDRKHDTIEASAQKARIALVEAFAAKNAEISRLREHCKRCETLPYRAWVFSTL